MSRTPPKRWCWDVETVDWDQVRCAVAISDAGDVERYAGRDAVRRMYEHMDRVKGDWIAHAGGIFDTLLASQARGKPWREVILSGSAVLCARDGDLRLRDSFRWWLSPLKKVGEFCDRVEQARDDPAHGSGYWLKREVDRSRIRDLSDAECLDYCEHDTRILARGVELARDYLAAAGVERSCWTAGASALALLEQIEPWSVWRQRKHRLHWRTAIRASECVRGARVECFARGHVEGVYCYDLKSAYPAAYARRPVGLGAIYLDDADPTKVRAHPDAIWRCRWRWPHRDRIAPVLDQTTGCGAGWCEAWLVPDEVRLLEGEGVLVRRVDGWAPECMSPIGQAFVRDLYAEKERGSFFAKVFLNSLHGKANERIVREQWRDEKPPDGTWYGEKPRVVGDYWAFHTIGVGRDGMCPPHVQPLTAAHILGRTRARISRILLAVERAGGRVCYSDTDSVHCSLPPNRMPMRLGKELGQLAFEGGPFSGYYAGNKAYLLFDSAGVVCKSALKGMPLHALADGIVEPGWPALFRQARDGETGRDLRAELFRHALQPLAQVQVQKDGIASFATGLRLKEGFRRYTQNRTFSPHDRAKLFSDDGAWQYLSPTEKIGRASALRESGLDDDFDRAENIVDTEDDPL